VGSEGAMSKYGQLSRTNGHSKWFLQRTLVEHDKTMDDPWMQMIYKQSFSVKQYAAWLVRNHACFAAMENEITETSCPEVYDQKLLRTPALETDLHQLLGASWRGEADQMARDSPATQSYLAHFEEDSTNNFRLAAHAFLQYNAVLSGGTYLGKMVSAKLSLVKGAPGVAFYAFLGVGDGKEAARVQQYLRDFDKLSLSDEERDDLLVCMRRIYADTEELMKECFDLNPVAGLSYNAAKDGGSPEGPPPPCSEQLELSLAELHCYIGEDGGRILMSLAGELLDVSAGSEMYGPGGSYALLAGRDVTRCLATMSLESSELDDLAWEPDNSEEEQALVQWRTKLKEKYPVAGSLNKSPVATDAGPEGLRQRTAASTSAPSAPAAAGAAASDAPAGETQKCPISGKEGVGCPLSTFGIIKKPAPKAKAATSSSGGTSGFTAGKSLLASVEASSSATEDWWLSKLCPLHWDNATMKAFVIAACTCWLHGIFVGWMLHKQIRG